MSIPYSQFAAVNPSVLSAAGSNIALTGLVLTQSTLVANSVPVSYADAKSVGDVFGYDSDEYNYASIYFVGPDGVTKRPSSLLISGYNSSPTSNSVYGVSLSSTTPAKIGAMSTTLTAVTNGVTATYDLSSIPTLSSIEDIYDYLQQQLTNIFTVNFNSNNNSLIIGVMYNGTGENVTEFTGTLADNLGISKSSGALYVTGINFQSMTKALTTIAAANANFGSIGHVWEPSLDDMLLISAWVSGQNDRYAYAGWYDSADASGAGDLSSFAYEVAQASYDGTIPIFGDMTHGAAVQSYIASIDWDAANGRTTLAFRTWSGLLPYVTDGTVAENLITNGYNFYGRYGANGNSDDLMRNGSMPGQWKWVDSYINQIYLNAQLQYSVVQLFKGSKSIPFNSAGRTLIRAALKDPIDAALNFGSIRTGVTLSDEQAASITSIVGSDVSSAIYSDGYYLHIPTATAAERAARTSPTIYFWYADGGSVQSITIASVEVQ